MEMGSRATARARNSGDRERPVDSWTKSAARFVENSNWSGISGWTTRSSVPWASWS